MTTIPKYDKPIMFSYTYKTGGFISEKTMDGEIPADQDSFAMEPGSTLTLTVPEKPDTGERWEASSSVKALEITDKGFKPENPDPHAMGSAGYHSFMLKLNGVVPENTPFHLVLNRLGKAVAEKTLNIKTAFTITAGAA